MRFLYEHESLLTEQKIHQLNPTNDDSTTMTHSLIVVSILLSAIAWIPLLSAFSAQHGAIQPKALHTFFSLSASNIDDIDEDDVTKLVLATDEEKEAYLNALAEKLMSELPNETIKDRMQLIKSWAGDYDQEMARKRIQKQIDENDVLIFGFSGCPYTQEAKEILKEQNVKFVSREFDTLPTADGYALRAELATMLNRTEVPAIFIKGKYIGGLNDGPGIKAIVEEGKLKTMLQG